MRNLVAAILGISGGVVLFLSIDLIGTRIEAQSEMRGFQPWAVEADLLAADTTRVVIAAAAGITRIVVTVNCTVLTSAAQAVDVESSDGAVEVLRLPVSATGQHRLQLIHGIALPSGTGLRIQPVAAGPAVHCVAEGYTRGVQ